jgi:exodeoxyribonuclease VII small subunit
MSEETQPAFSAAMGELEEILERIEGEEIDIDRLAEELRRAAELLDLCRAKIRRAEVEVTQIVQSLEEDEPPAEPEPPGEDEDEDEGEDEDDQDDIPF